MNGALSKVIFIFFRNSRNLCESVEMFAGIDALCAGAALVRHTMQPFGDTMHVTNLDHVRYCHHTMRISDISFDVDMKDVTNECNRWMPRSAAQCFTTA